MCAAVYRYRHLVKATEVTAGLAESNGSLLPDLWRDSLHITCGLTACTPGSAPGPALGNEYGKTLPFYGPMHKLISLDIPEIWVCSSWDVRADRQTDAPRTTVKPPWVATPLKWKPLYFPLRSYDVTNDVTLNTLKIDDWLIGFTSRVFDINAELQWITTKCRIFLFSVISLPYGFSERSKTSILAKSSRL